MTLEDETGIANAVVWPKILGRYRRAVMGARLIVIDGSIQRSPEGIVHLVASRLTDRSHELKRLLEADAFVPALAHADEIARPPHPRVSNHPRNERIIPKSRDFR